MQNRPCITLLTDFGLDDEYVGVMKGVILSVTGAVPIVDLCHRVAPQDVRGAALLLGAAYPYFPAGTVHVAVVDPGVGGQRRIVCLQAGDFLFLAPDNGLLSVVLDREASVAAWAVTNSDYFLDRVGNTFHGRDIFAPVAGHLARGLAPHHLGPEIAAADLIRLSLPKPRKEGDTLAGEVVHVDRFGNLATNIPARLLAPWLTDPKAITVQINDTTIRGLAVTYQQVPAGHPLALIASRDVLEIAVRDGDAARLLGAGIGTPVLIHRR